MPSFFFRELQLIIVLLLSRNSYMSWSTWSISLKLRVGFSVFDSTSFSLNFIYLFIYLFFQQKADSLTLKRHNSFQNKSNRKATRSFARKPLIFKLQQELWKFHDICVSWRSPKTGLETNFLNLLLKLKFWVRHFFSVVTFK